MEQWLQTAERFFLDLVGTVVPGSFVAVPLVVASPSVAGFQYFSVPPEGAFDWVGLIVVSYVLGHVVSSVGDICIKPLLGRFARWSPFERMWGGETAFREFRILVRPHLHDVGEISKDEPGQSRRERDVHELRNIAMSLITADERHLVYRFRFLSLLNFGVATSVGILVLVLLVLLGIQLFDGVRVAPSPWLLLVAIVVPFLLHRGADFERRTIEVPFAMAVAHLLRDPPTREPIESNVADSELGEASTGPRGQVS